DHPELLDRLGVLGGVEAHQCDPSRREHVVGPDTNRALLAAMPVPAGNAAEIRTSLAALADDPWRAIVPPVMLARAGEPLSIDVVVDQSAASNRLEAVLERED